MVNRIETLEREKAEYMRKRKRTSDNDNDNDEDDDDIIKSSTKQQKLEESETRMCRTCREILPIETFERTSMRKKCTDGTTKIYTYRRHDCKRCTNTQRRERHMKRLK